MKTICFSDMTKSEILAWLKARGVTFRKSATKAECVVEALQQVQELRRNELLRATTLSLGPESHFAPDLPAPRTLNDCGETGFIRGWDINTFSQKVFPAWSSCTGHGELQSIHVGRAGMTGGSQGSKPLYSTRMKALEALRYRVALVCADALLDISAMIYEESHKEPGEG